MVALTANRNTPRISGDVKADAVAAGTVIFTGALLMRNAAGFVAKGATVAGGIGIGRAEERADNAAGANGAQVATYRPGVFPFNNLSSDAVTRAGIGKLCYIVDDQTAAATHATNSRSPAGIVEGIDNGGVWVRLDEAVTRGAV